MFGIGGQELLLVLIIVLVLFGGKKIPEFTRGLGEAIREFRKSLKDDKNEKEKEEKPSSKE